ncbi:hypothetical protein CDAR_511431 [Caerostris darwini]|uniref:Uncharacterized protein n=1 Tax=Caerostris darwini TaxID=1538125 RepID=A0AAV4PXG3_9ARAC|nr:hypothetical protein CDAR_511431 [Caerostris darwini]
MPKSEIFRESVYLEGGAPEWELATNSAPNGRQGTLASHGHLFPETDINRISNFDITSKIQKRSSTLSDLQEIPFFAAERPPDFLFPTDTESINLLMESPN